MYWVIPSEITSGVRKLALVDTGVTWFAEDRYLVIDLDDLEAEWVTYDQLYNVFRKYDWKVIYNYINIHLFIYNYVKYIIIMLQYM